jgi:hypothetical protein
MPGFVRESAANETVGFSDGRTRKERKEAGNTISGLWEHLHVCMSKSGALHGTLDIASSLNARENYVRAGDRKLRLGLVTNCF